VHLHVVAGDEGKLQRLAQPAQFRETLGIPAVQEQLDADPEPFGEEFCEPGAFPNRVSLKVVFIPLCKRTAFLSPLCKRTAFLSPLCKRGAGGI
jgi:hypothetical protein